jgi:hypothetical protein
LKTKFYSKGFQDTAGKLKRQPFMIQEELGPQRRLLAEVTRMFGEHNLPRQLKEKIAELWVAFLKGGIYPQDMNWGNIYVELKGADDAVWNTYFKSGKDSVEIGLLDFDRIVTWEDYVNRRTGKMGEFLNYVELKKAPYRLKSMARVYGDEQNLWLLKMHDNELELDAYIKARPGPYWPSLEFALEKQLEYHGYLNFDVKNQMLLKGIVEPEIFEEVFQRTGTFTRFNHSSRYNPFPIGPISATGRPSSPYRRRSRSGPTPVWRRRIGAVRRRWRSFPMQPFRKAA